LAPQTQSDGFLGALSHWDSQWYGTISSDGYINRNQCAFFPLLPLLGRVVVVLSAHLVPVDYALLVVSNAAMASMMYLLIARPQSVFRITAANQGVWRAASLAFAPASFFLLSGYAESLSLLLTFLTFSNSIRSVRLKALVAGLLAITSPIGFAATLIFLAYQFYREKQLRSSMWHRFTIGFLALLPFCFWSGFLTLRFGSPVTWMTAQQGWARSFTLPFVPLLQILEQLKGPPWEVLRNMANIGALVLLIVLVLSLLWRSHEWRYRLYGVFFFTVSTATMVHSGGVVYAEAMFRHCFCNLWFLESYWGLFVRYRRLLMLLSLILMTIADCLLLLGYPMT